jgi:lysophospholipase L1-like esterase
MVQPAPRMRYLLLIALLTPAALPAAELKWHAFPDDAKFTVLGLPWFEANRPSLSRVPVKIAPALTKGVQNRAQCPAGARITLHSTTSRLVLRTAAPINGGAKRFETYVNGRACPPTAAESAATKNEYVLFTGLDRAAKEIVVYLPHLQGFEIAAVGVDADARFGGAPQVYARPLPIVFYGSSVCQGSGALNPGQTYPAILGRELNIDIINLGFGGAGKAEPEVVELVNSLPASCYVFDLGKSYGAQDATAFTAMLRAIRQKHPGVPLVVATPITSVKEVKEPSYSERSIHTRTAMRQAFDELTRAGEKHLFLVKGEDLLGFKDHAMLSKDGVHPSERGYALIAERLAPTLRQALGL